MAQQIIDTTTPQPNGKQGEPIRTAFEKSNANFTELYEGVGASLKSTQNLADLDDPTQARANLELGTAAQGDLQKLSTDYFGDVEPSVTWPGMTWAHLAEGVEKRRSADNLTWVITGELFQRKANRGGEATQNFKAAPSVDPNDVVVRSERNYVLLAAASANYSASVILAWEDTDFDHYEVLWTGLITQTGSGTAIGLTPSSNSGASFPVANALLTSITGLGSNSATPTPGTIEVATSVGATVSQWILNSTVLTGGNSVNPQGAWGRLVTLDNKFFRGDASFSWYAGTGKWSHTVAGYMNLGALGVANAIRIAAFSGLIAAGDFRIYGVR